jgi:hypothetical protein
MRRTRIVLATLAFCGAGCGTPQGPYRTGFPLQNTPSSTARTHVDGVLPAEESGSQGPGNRKARVPDAVMIRDEGFGGYGDSLVPSS